MKVSGNDRELISNILEKLKLLNINNNRNNSEYEDHMKRKLSSLHSNK